MEYPLHSLFVLAPVKVCRTCNLNTQQSEICLKPQKKSLIKRQWRLKTENLQDLSSTLAKRTDVLKFQSFHRKVCDSGKHKFINYARFFYYRDQKMHYIYINLYIIIIIINTKDSILWSVPSPQLQMLAPTLLRSSNCSPSLWSVAVWFQRVSVLWHSLQVWKRVPSVFIYLV